MTRGIPTAVGRSLSDRGSFPLQACSSCLRLVLVPALVLVLVLVLVLAFSPSPSCTRDSRAGTALNWGG